GRLPPLLDVGGPPERPLLRDPVPLALLLALPVEGVPARHGAALCPASPAPHHRRAVAGLPDPVGAGPLPTDLLLLPQGLLPGVLGRAAGLRHPRRAPPLQRGDVLPADLPEPPPLHVLRRGRLRRRPGLGRAARLPVPRRLRDRGGNAGHVGQRRPAGRVHLLLPFLSPRVRRRRRRVLEVAGPVRALAVPDPGQRAAPRPRLVQPVQRGADGPVHSPGVDGRDQRSAHLLRYQHEWVRADTRRRPLSLGLSTPLTYAPSSRRASIRVRSPRTAGPQPRDVL